MGSDNLRKSSPKTRNRSMTSPNEHSFPTYSSSSEAAPEASESESSPSVLEGEAESKIPLPPLSPPPEPVSSAERLAKDIFRLDIALIALVLVLAFLLASFPVRNTDFWMHLASGRLIAQGQFHFGTDPFSYMTEGLYWTNHNWLYDLLLYGFVNLLGGPESPLAGGLLVIFKALLLSFLAWVMVQTRRHGQSMWAPVFCTALAFLAMSPRLLLQPTLVSYLFLGLTLYILQKPRHLEIGQRQAAKHRSPLTIYWWLLPLFMLWANLDIWFLLGPATLGLFLLGQVVQQLTMPVRTGEDAPEPGLLLRLLVVLLLGSAACLVNPHHYHVFTLPTQLGFSGSAQALEADPFLRQIFDSPFQESYFVPGRGLNVAGLAYFPLLVLGLISFGLSAFTCWRWWRFLIWLGFAALAAHQSRNIAFFAVVAGPITALNLQDFASVRFVEHVEPSRAWNAWSLGGRVITLLLLAILIAGAYPGWLHGRPTDPQQAHRVAWAVDVDPSLRGAAVRLKEWREKGLLKADNHGFNFSPDIANYWSWFSADSHGIPQEKDYFDYRLDAFPAAVTRNYIETRQALQGDLRRGVDAAGKRTNWQDAFRKEHIDHVVLNLNDSKALLTGVQLRSNPDDWDLAYQDGRTMIYTWKDPRHKATAVQSKLPPFDPLPLAFGPDAEKAPESGLMQAPAPHDIWTRYLNGSPARPLALDQAEMYRLDFENIQRIWIFPYLVGVDLAGWTGVVANSVYSPAVATLVSPSHATLSTLVTFAAFSGNRNAFNLLLNEKALGPADLAYLAIRAARHAIAASPDDGLGYLSLAQAYQALSSAVEDRWHGPPTQEMPPRLKLRRAEIATALEYGLRLRPNDAKSHLSLFELYLQMRYVDLARDHLREALRILSNQQGADFDSQENEQFQGELEALQKRFKDLDTQVVRQENEFEVTSQSQPLMGRVGMALSRGLGKRALEQLSQADASMIGLQEARVYFELLIAMGRPEDVREGMKEDFRPALGFTYDWYKALSEAALGNYRVAGEYLDETTPRLEESNEQMMLLALRTQMFFSVSPDSFAAINSLVASMRQVADYYVVRGLLALEEGDTAKARETFRKVLAMGGGELAFEGRTTARHYLDLLDKAQTTR
jgi:tetratricopeptide (TPR) repeat protein